MFHWDTSLYTGQDVHAGHQVPRGGDANDQGSQAAAEPEDEYSLVQGAFQADVTYPKGSKVLVRDDTMDDKICVAEVCIR